jgi:hypothetical protein
MDVKVMVFSDVTLCSLLGRCQSYVRTCYLGFQPQNGGSRSLIGIVTCTGVSVTKITGSRSADGIYWHFGYKLS